MFGIIFQSAELVASGTELHKEEVIGPKSIDIEALLKLSEKSDCYDDDVVSKNWGGGFHFFHDSKLSILNRNDLHLDDSSAFK